jgi:hypothetical protein
MVSSAIGNKNKSKNSPEGYHDRFQDKVYLQVEPEMVKTLAIGRPFPRQGMSGL